MPFIFNSFLCTWQLVFVISSCVTSTHKENKRSKSGLSIIHAAVFLYCIYWQVSIHQVQYLPSLLGSEGFHLLRLGDWKSSHFITHVQSVGMSLVLTHFMGSWKLCVVFYFCCWSSSFMKSKFFVIVYRLCRNLNDAIHHHHHHRLYSPGRALASSSKCRQWPLSWAFFRQFPQPNFLASSSTPSIHFDFGRPRPHWPPGSVHNIFSGNSFSSIRTTWPSHLSLLDFIALTVFGSL